MIPCKLNSEYFDYYISASTTVLPPSSLSSMPSGSCGNFTLSEPAFSSETSGVYLEWRHN